MKPQVRHSLFQSQNTLGLNNGFKIRSGAAVASKRTPQVSRLILKAYKDESSLDEYDFQSHFEAAALKLQAIEDYTILMQQPEPDILMGAVLIAQHKYPYLEYDDVEEQLDDLAAQVQAHIPEGAYPLKIISIISEYLYKNRGFRGNNDDFYDVDNSCINKVIERRLGIPLTLALVYQQVASRCGLNLLGCNIPGHFFLTPESADLEVFIDAFEGGSVAFLEDAEETLAKIYGNKVKLDPTFLRKKEPLPSRVFLARMLKNLKAIYIKDKDWLAVYNIQQYLRATRPGDIDEIRNTGYYLWHLERYSECAAALHEYVNRAPDAEDAPKVLRLLRVLKDLDTQEEEE